jgi:hypothetical protein
VFGCCGVVSEEMDLFLSCLLSLPSKQNVELVSYELTEQALLGTPLYSETPTVHDTKNE